LVEFTRRSDRLAPRLPLRINSFDPPLEKPPTGTANRLFQQTHSTSSPFPLQTEHVSPAVKQKQVWAKNGQALCSGYLREGINLEGRDRAPPGCGSAAPP